MCEGSTLLQQLYKVGYKGAQITRPNDFEIPHWVIGLNASLLSSELYIYIYNHPQQNGWNIYSPHTLLGFGTGRVTCFGWWHIGKHGIKKRCKICLFCWLALLLSSDPPLSFSQGPKRANMERTPSLSLSKPTDTWAINTCLLVCSWVEFGVVFYVILLWLQLTDTYPVSLILRTTCFHIMTSLKSAYVL